MSKFNIRQTSQFKRDLKRMRRQGRDISALDETVFLLQHGLPLPSQYHDHALTGNWEGFRECHIAPNWLLIYMKEKDILILTLSRTGSHADLFDK